MRPFMKMILNPLYFCASLLLLVPVAATAGHGDVSRLAAQLHQISGELAYRVRGDSAYSSVRQRANHLSREAEDLAEAVRRNRNSSRVESQFEDVRRRYINLEEALLRTTRRQYDPYLARELAQLSEIYSRLSREFYGSASLNTRRGYAYQPPFVSERYTPRQPYTARRQPPGLSWGNDGYRQPPQWGREQGRARGHNKGNGKGKGHNKGREHGQGQQGHDQGRIQAQRQPSFDHRSPVLERQQRDLRQQHSAPHAPAGFGTRRSRVTETGRRNHYE